MIKAQPAESHSPSDRAVASYRAVDLFERIHLDVTRFDDSDFDDIDLFIGAENGGGRAFEQTTIEGSIDTPFTICPSLSGCCSRNTAPCMCPTNSDNTCCSSCAPLTTTQLCGC
jgi:hypothetical protein